MIINHFFPPAAKNPKVSVNNSILVIATLGTIQLDVCQVQIFRKTPSRNGTIPSIATEPTVITRRRVLIVPVESISKPMAIQAL